MLASEPTRQVGEWQVLATTDGGYAVMTVKSNELTYRDKCTCGKRYPCEHIRTLFPSMAVQSAAPRAVPDTLAPIQRYTIPRAPDVVASVEIPIIPSEPLHLYVYHWDEWSTGKIVSHTLSVLWAYMYRIYGIIVRYSVHRSRKLAIVNSKKQRQGNRKQHYRARKG